MYHPKVIKIDKVMTFEKGQIIKIRRIKHNRYIFSYLGQRIFIPVGDFSNLKILQLGDSVQLNNGKIGTVENIYNDEIEIKTGKEDNQVIKIKIEDIAIVTSSKK